ncbi:SH2 domain-containing protein 4A [Ahaetulla prasina]|uniref:SH2 domain-containing protein 4A n=1 Tax=Ahaetulla prasina TaxID=499056 RepID=UPI0026479B5B|nr:SH2 domain-containing protein 4A [Ahaetulla prasina]XP_058036444.1 SH2 domain-containing protein 4A [Ahaetulla prasina]
MPGGFPAMLKQILSDMYVDPELLAELNEEQKQILFFKMRQEQVRRWKEREAVATTPKPILKKDHGKSVQWKLGADGDIWVWIMGEHMLDKPYDLLCSEILAERVKQQSLQQVETKRRTPMEKATESSVSSPPQFLSELQPGSEIQQDNKNFVQRYVPKGVENTPTVGNHRNLECIQAPVTKLRDVGQILVDDCSHSSKYNFQQNREMPMKTTTTETRTGEEITLDCPSESIQKLDKEDPDWLESLRRSKAADERRRSLAKHARDDYKRLSFQGIRKDKAADVSQTFQKEVQGKPLPPPLPPKPKNLTTKIADGKPERKQSLQRSTSSSTRENIVRWFKEEQINLRAGFEKSVDQIAPWFHGILTTKKAEEHLEGLAPGSFLIRVSEKIKGYVLSYLSPEGCKHFLIDASGDSYSFLGVDQLQHSTLADLVECHKDEPITSLGKECLHYPCGQQGQLPDYLELFE